MPSPSSSCTRESRATPPLRAALAGLAATLVVLSAPAPALADAGNCGDLYITQFGPYDYRTERDKYKVVVDHHFTPDIEALMLRNDGLPPGGDLSYTLRCIPNHHRALVSVMRYGQRWGDQRLQFPVACYFDRALRWRPDDTVVRGLYANYLISKNRRDEAVQQLEAATNYAGDNGFSHYNIGLLYLEMGLYDKAFEQDQRARSLGFQRTQIEEQLKRAGKWQERPAAPDAPAN